MHLRQVTPRTIRFLQLIPKTGVKRAHFPACTTTQPTGEDLTNEKINPTIYCCIRFRRRLPGICSAGCRPRGRCLDDSLIGSQWTTQPVVAAGYPNTLYMNYTAELPSTNFEIFWGIPAGVNTWTVTPGPRGIDTDLSFTWTVSGNGTAQMQVTSCSRNCGPFTAGTTHNFQQILTDASPPPPPTDRPQGGLWEGQTSDYDVCFNVSPDGTSLTPDGSQCGPGGGESFDINFFSLDGPCDKEDADLDFDENLPIINNKFELDTGSFFGTGLRVEGTFANGILTGTFFVNVLGATCTGEFTATPAQ